MRGSRRKQHPAIAIGSHLSKPEEVDRYLLAVTPGQALSLSVDGRSLNSPVDGHLAHSPAPRNPRRGWRDAEGRGDRFPYQVPADVSAVQIAVHDLLNRGGPHFVYRLRIARAGRFSLALLRTALNLRRTAGRSPRCKSIARGYGGPIDLKVGRRSLIHPALSNSRRSPPVERSFVTLSTTGRETDRSRARCESWESRPASTRRCAASPWSRLPVAGAGRLSRCDSRRRAGRVDAAD